MASKLVFRPLARATLARGTPLVASSRARVAAALLVRPTLPTVGTVYPMRAFSSISADDLKGSISKKKEDTAAEDLRGGNRSIVHFKLSPNKHPLDVAKLDAKEKVWENPMHHSVWTKEEVDSIRITHLEPTHWTGTVAYAIAQTLRFSFDLLAGFKHRTPDEAMFLNRIIFLETVAGVPGMVAGMVRHLHSLRLLRRDNGFIHTLEEAENERMHLLTFLTLKKPGPFFRACVVVTQGVFFNAFFLAYLISPRLCHSLVGYIEEEAVKTYTHILQELDAGNLPLFTHHPAPPIAISYWKLAPNSTLRDLLLAVRADEATHREVNHTFAALKEDDYNPYIAKQEYNDKAKVVDLPPKKA